jgi:hypothetical protein
MWLSAITRSVKIEAPAAMSHFMPARLKRWVNTILQAASVTPLPIGVRRRRRARVIHRRRVTTQVIIRLVVLRLLTQQAANRPQRAGAAEHAEYAARFFLQPTSHLGSPRVRRAARPGPKIASPSWLMYWQA